MRAVGSVRRLVHRRIQNVRRRSDKFASDLPRALCAAGTFLCAILSISAGLSDEFRVDRVWVLEQGILHASGGNQPIAQSSLGAVENVRDICLIQSTTTIPTQANRYDSADVTSSRALPSVHAWSCGL